MSATTDAIDLLERCFIERIGMSIGNSGHRAQIERFISARMHGAGVASLDDYLRLLLRPDAQEFQRLVDAATVGLTWFFRDGEQLDAFAELLRGELRGRPLRVWCAGCSSGEEAYSIAMVAEALGIDAQVLGTDVNETLLARARAGRYSAWSARGLPEAYRQWLAPAGDGFEVAWAIRRRTSFLRHSLLEPAPASGEGRRWDVVFCRNVLIYFHASTVGQALAHLARAVGDDGWLFLGASEMMLPTPGFGLVPVGPRHALRRAAPSLPFSSVAATVPVSLPAWPPARPVPSSLPPSSPSLAPLPSAASAPARATPREADVAQRFARAHARYAAGVFTEAMQLLAELLAADPLFAEARMLLGMAYFRNGDRADAVEALRAALFLAPELWPAHFYLALCHDAAGDRAAALHEFRRVIECADRPLPPSPARELLDELSAWKPDVVALARRHLRR